ncbi:type I restriction-modification system subunit M [Deinococcus marmoris]|uniref:type I restriction-modification system subunit M n=1 Tax=Deinococcus marmoris TaxID=249408 RepID=UPI00049573E6|nr:class I SAM-dependent DNA methyltransferase [Deinococcus marmoris]
MTRTSKTKSKVAPSTAQRLSSVIKSVRDIMRKDKGLSGDADRLPMLTWLMFLKFLDDLEQGHEAEAAFEGRPYTPILHDMYRWRGWARSDLQGDDLLKFINNEKYEFTPGEDVPGLLAYLRNLQGEGSRDRRTVVAEIFKGVQNRMIDGYLLKEVVQKLDTLDFTSSDESHTLGALYEGMLKEMRDAAGDAGEFYTPRAVVRFMVKALDPHLGETVLDPACGTGGFLVEAFEHLRGQVKTTDDTEILQTRSVLGGEAKPLPYLLAQMNLTLHGLESPQIDSGNSLRHNLAGLGDRDRVDVILANPPFGGEEEKGIQNNFPADKRTGETALLFMQLIMRKLRRPVAAHKGGRAGVVVPNGFLFAQGVGARIKQEMLEGFNLHTIVRLPSGVFAPYTSIPTNILFFERGEPTQEIWYYEHPLPTGQKNYTKTRPVQFEEFAPLLAWWSNREESEQAWRVPWAELHEGAKQVAEPLWQAAQAATTRANQAAAKAKGAVGEREKQTLLDQEKQELESARDAQTQGDAAYWPVFNLDSKNPNVAPDLEHQPPGKLLADILSKERRILTLLEELQTELEQGEAVHA